jgi:hypothetical protein
MKSGDFFGDREMLSGLSAAVYTAGKGGCKLLALNKGSFERQLGALQQSLVDHVVLSTMQSIELVRIVHTHAA